MIDIHSHVLPCLDDGAADMDESLHMLADYAAQGVTDVVCTPHLLPHHFETEDILTSYLDMRDARLAQLQEFARSRQINVTLLPGTEITLTTGMLPFVRKPEIAARIAINNGSYLLVELPRALSGGLRTLEGLLFEIQLAGLLPILAHPERTAHNEGVMPVLRKWVEGGRVLLQVNACHLADDERLTGERRERYRARQGIAWELLHCGLVSVVASDAHDPVSRPVQNEIGHREIQRLMGYNNANRLMLDNPERMIQDSAVKNTEHLNKPPINRN